MSRDLDKWRCGWRAHWIGTTSQLLSAPSPFDPEDTLFACPVCKSSEDLEACCDADGCKQAVSCGTPTAGEEEVNRYCNTCSKHRPKGVSDVR